MSNKNTLNSELIDRLRAYNAWRRQDDEPWPPQFDPEQIGRDIDEAIILLEEQGQRDLFQEVMEDLDTLLYLIECRRKTDKPADHPDTVKLQHIIYEIAARIQNGGAA